MDLGLKGPALASCLSELDATLTQPDPARETPTDRDRDRGSRGVEFSALMILYTRHAGLRAPSLYDPNQQEEGRGARAGGGLWVPTTTGQWVEVRGAYTPCLGLAWPGLIDHMPTFSYIILVPLTD
jgi:hypothetical protein